MSASDWVMQRLPNGADFSKNGVTQTVDVAVAAALEEYADKSEFAQKRYALADLLEILDADIEYETEKLGDWQGTKARYAERIQTLRDEAANESAGTSGSFENTGATFWPSISDEYSRTN